MRAKCSEKGGEIRLDMAKFFLDKRGANDKDEKRFDTQDLAPVREQMTAEGHAVRLCYLFTSVADVAYRTGDEGLKRAAYEAFENIINKRMYITGGVGSTPNQEIFEGDYQLDNHVAYNETCAALSLALFAHRMQELFEDSKYTDIIERVIYNGFISGVSLDGRKFFYQNPMKIDFNARKRLMGGRFKIEYTIAERVEVFWCSCCPPNITRFIPSIANFIYTLLRFCQQGSERYAGMDALLMKKQNKNARSICKQCAAGVLLIFQIIFKFG